MADVNNGSGGHAERDGDDRPWLRRPRRPLDLYDGANLRTALLVGTVVVGLVAGGFAGVTGMQRGGRVESAAMLLIGLALLALVVAYVQRPVRRPRGKRWRR